MKNVKEFMREHKDAIKKGAFLTVAALGSGAFGYGICLACNTVVNHKGIENILLDAERAYERKLVFVGAHDTPFKPEQLGEIGAKILACGATPDCGFTHFIAIGPYEK